ncbi:hypothetical protein [Alienimonas sp. DA493]|uniref:hypothetical protein n=1 Tax=Alienimonas sp. DA493 TaxID=3373605 RepID=UPI0037550184
MKTGRSPFVWLTALALAVGTPWAACAAHLDGKPDRGKPVGEEGEGESAELWEALDAEDPVGGADGLWTSPGRTTFAGPLGDPRTANAAVAAVTRWSGPRLPRPPPRTR